MGTTYFYCLCLILLPLAMAGKEELLAVIHGNGQFTQNLYNVLAREQGKNIFFSPISAHLVLAMAYQGSVGSTYDAFTKVLAVKDHLQAANGYKDVMTHLNNVRDVQLHIANKIYIQNDYSLRSDFNSITESNFFSSIDKVDFKQSAKTANQINQWVESKTNNKIKNLIDAGSLDDSTRLVLVNAIYFKGNWAQKFDKELTKTEKFYLNDDDSIDVQMMNKEGKFLYKEDQELDAKVLELPYSNADVSLIVILPNKRNGIAELEKKLSKTDLTKITDNMYKPEVKVKLPKFKLETTIDLNNPLAEMGLGIIFQDKANFSNMLEQNEPLVVSKVIQKAFIEVNEEGTEAAAATGVIMVGYSLPPPPEDFFAEHPFIVFLKVDLQTGPILTFSGRISNPLVI